MGKIFVIWRMHPKDYLNFISNVILEESLDVQAKEDIRVPSFVKIPFYKVENGKLLDKAPDTFWIFLPSDSVPEGKMINSKGEVTEVPVGKIS